MRHPRVCGRWAGWRTVYRALERCCAQRALCAHHSPLPPRAPKRRSRTLQPIPAALPSSTVARCSQALPPCAPPTPQARAAAERRAVNTVMQGSAADVIKRAMAALHSQLAAPAWAGAARLVLQVLQGRVFVGCRRV